MMTPLRMSLVLCATFTWLSQYSSNAWVSINLPQQRQCKVASLNSIGKGKNAQQRKIDEFLDVIESPVTDGRLPVEQDDTSSISSDPLVPLVETIVKAADMRKASDIRAIRVSKLTATTSFIVVVSGSSRPQNQAIAGAISDEVAILEDGMRTKGNGVPEGDANSGWILLDYGDVMVHIMTPKSRLFYDIEGRWEKGEDMSLDHILVPNAPLGSESGAAMGGGMAVDKEDDPFWS